MSEELEKIICRHLLREELSMEEKKSLDKWFSEEQNSHRILGQMRLMLDPKFEMERSRIKAETWKELMDSKYNQTKSSTSESSSHGINKFLRIAAVLVLISLVGLLSLELLEEEKAIVQTQKFIEKVALPGQKITTVLPDGTTVKLNSGSKLIVPEQFTGETREVTLTGEAFFEVERNEALPFHVNVEGGMKVVVLGTSFIVNTSNDGENIVAVRSGKVSVTSFLGDESIILQKNEVVRVSSHQSLKRETITNGDIFFGWVDNKLVLDAADFSEVLRAVKEWFGYKIEVNLDYSDFDVYSASLTNPSLKEVMESMAHSYKFSYEIDDYKKKIIIK